MEIFFSRSLRFFSLILLASSQVFAQVQADFPTNEETFSISDPEADRPQETSRHLATHPTGAIGLFHTVSAQLQPYGPYSFGLFLSGNYYSKLRFPANYTGVHHPSDLIHILVCPLRRILVPVFMNLGFLTTNDEAPINPLYRQNANIGFGGKFSYPVNNKLRAALMYAGEKRSAVNVIPNSQYALNHELTAIGTYDDGGKFATMETWVLASTTTIASATDQQPINVSSPSSMNTEIIL
ncbi:MAG: hypothetical protein R2877_07630 [Bdellovibrionota bacterium]